MVQWNDYDTDMSITGNLAGVAAASVIGCSPAK
jgi:hypothetical protein